MLGHVQTYALTRSPSTSRSASSASTETTSIPPRTQHVFVVYGPAGCGKSTVAQFIAKEFGFAYVEGDEHHPPANIAKMANNIPLSDNDRWDWLIDLREAAVASLSQSGVNGVVMTCSALKQKYRDVIRIASINDHGVQTHFICLQADRETLISRVGARKDHYMGAAMVDSQLRDFESPENREWDIVAVDVSGTKQENELLVASAVEALLENSRFHRRS